MAFQVALVAVVVKTTTQNKLNQAVQETCRLEVHHKEIMADQELVAPALVTTLAAAGVLVP